MKEQYGQIPDWQQLEEDTHPVLGDAEVHLWWFPLKLSPIQTDTALTLLSNIQRDRYHRRKTAERKQSYLAGRYYLLNLLSHYTATPVKKILLAYTGLNKPYLSGKEQNIEFNFTDTNVNQNTEGDCTSYGLFAFCKHVAIGVDIESLERSANFKAISASRFSPEEQDFVTGIDGELNSQRCLAIWTRKEAFGKAIGKGINFKMNALNLSSPNSHELNFSSHDDDWRLTQIQITDKVISCITHQGHQALDIKAFKSVNHIP